MKTFSTLLTSLLMSASVFAADAKPKTILTVTTVDQSNLRVILDGKRFEPNNSSFRIDGINDGYHTIQVYRQGNGGFVPSSRKRFDLIYSSTITMKKKTSLLITIDRGGRASFQESRIKGGRDWNDDRDDSYDRDNGGQWGQYDNHEAYDNIMSDYEFDNTLRAIDKEWLESNKLKSASQVVKSNMLTAAQVKQMAQLFSFENNKLEIAKQAYANTVDKRNYSLVFEVFSFSSSKSDLERFIRTNR